MDQVHLLDFWFYSNQSIDRDWVRLRPNDFEFNSTPLNKLDQVQLQLLDF